MFFIKRLDPCDCCDWTPAIALTTSPINHHAIENFYHHYQCQWVPDILTLTISSELDYICPPTIFTTDPRFQRSHITNKIIPQVGHCPWLSQLEALQEYCGKFIPLLV